MPRKCDPCKKLKIGKPYRVSWYDAFLLPGTWTDMRHDKNNEVAKVYSYGIMVKDEELYITLAGSVVTMEHEGSKTPELDCFGDVNRILKSTIFDAKEIK